MGIFDSLFESRSLRLAKKIIRTRPGHYDTKAHKKLARQEDRELAIPIFMDYFHKSGDAVLISFALKSIGTIAVIGPLLELFRSIDPTIRESQLSQHGTTPTDHIIHALCGIRVPGAIEILRTLCTPDEFEMLIVRGHEAGCFVDNPELAMALCHIGTPSAITCLVNAWVSSLKPILTMKEALIKLGDKAHPQLLDVFERRYRGFMKRQRHINNRKRILEVLSESGDEDCIPRIYSLMESDAYMAEEAKAAIVAISNRHKSFVLDWDDLRNRFGKKKEEQFGEIQEKPDKTKVADYSLLQLASPVFRTSYSPYDDDDQFVEQAYSLMESGKWEEAKKIILNGLENCNTKDRLYDMIANIYVNEKNTLGIGWYMQSCLLGSESWVPYLSVSYAARAIGLDELACRCLNACDVLESGMSRIPGFEIEITNLVRNLEYPERSQLLAAMNKFSNAMDAYLPGSDELPQNQYKREIFLHQNPTGDPEKPPLKQRLRLLKRS